MAATIARALRFIPPSILEKLLNLSTADSIFSPALYAIIAPITTPSILRAFSPPPTMSISFFPPSTTFVITVLTFSPYSVNFVNILFALVPSSLTSPRLSDHSFTFPVSFESRLKPFVAYGRINLPTFSLISFICAWNCLVLDSKESIDLAASPIASFDCCIMAV